MNSWKRKSIWRRVIITEIKDSILLYTIGWLLLEQTTHTFLVNVG